MASYMSMYVNNSNRLFTHTLLNCTTNTKPMKTTLNFSTHNCELEIVWILENILDISAKKLDFRKYFGLKKIGFWEIFWIKNKIGFWEIFCKAPRIFTYITHSAQPLTAGHFLI